MRLVMGFGLPLLFAAGNALAAPDVGAITSASAGADVRKAGGAIAEVYRDFGRKCEQADKEQIKASTPECSGIVAAAKQCQSVVNTYAEEIKKIASAKDDLKACQDSANKAIGAAGGWLMSQQRELRDKCPNDAAAKSILEFVSFKQGSKSLGDLHNKLAGKIAEYCQAVAKKIEKDKEEEKAKKEKQDKANGKKM